MSATVLHVTAYFSGHVQGVGFRYAAMQVAREFEVSGCVRNILDGRVLVEVEGQEKEVDEFLSALGERMHGYVRKIERTQQTRTPAFQGFAIL